MSNDLMCRALALHRDIPDEKCGPYQDCREVIHFSIFFDGTGNNRDADVPTNRWSNIARMYDAAKIGREKGMFAEYISGIGTAFNWTVLPSEINTVKNEDAWGGLTGSGGERRMNLGSNRLDDRLRDVLIARAKVFGGELEKYASANSEKGFSKVNVALSKYRLIKIINISLFGFSRGAALARAFSNRLIDDCEKKDGELIYSGYPIRFNFLGLFDTVASFGIPAANVRTPFDKRELIISPYIERCVHYVAAHDVRFSFPVDLIRKNGKLSGEWLEKVFPGVHSDVGGGYEPLEQGSNNNYSRIPMRDMMREAIASGVRMVGYEELRQTQKRVFKERFECYESTEIAYNHYMAACGPMTGTVENQIKRHLEVFYSANGTMQRKGMKTAYDRSLADSKVKRFGAIGMAQEVALQRDIENKQKWERFGLASEYTTPQTLAVQPWQIAAWDKSAADGVVNFVSNFIHDSKVDFVMNQEPLSYFAPRGIQESSVGFFNQWGKWLDDAGRSARDGAKQVYKILGKK